MAQPVWVLSVDLQTKTATFQSGMADAAKAARGSFQDIQSGAARMGSETAYSMKDARHGVMLLGEEFGVHIPRALTAFMTGIGPIGAAMEAAFPFLAIAVGATILLTHLAKLREEGEKLTESQIKFGTAVAGAFNTLEQKLLQAGIQADELNGNHLAALKKQLELLDQQSMAELVRQFDLVAKAADAVFTQLKGHWYSLGIGADGAKHALDIFKTQYDSLLAQGRDKDAADLLKGTRESAEHVLGLMHQLEASRGSSSKGGSRGDSGAYADAAKQLRELGVLSAVTHDITEKELASQEALVNTLRTQESIQIRVGELKKAQSSNAGQAAGSKMSDEAEKALKAQFDNERKLQQDAEKLWEQNYQRALGALQQSEREKIQATEQGSAARLAALDAALKEENKYGLQETGFYRGLLTQRVETVRQAAAEEAKQRERAGQEAATHEQRMAELELAATKEHNQLLISGRRIRVQEQQAMDLAAAEADYKIRMTAYSKEIAALDKNGKDYENKLKALQNRQEELIKQHENKITDIKDRAEKERNARLLSAEQQVNDTIAQGLSSVIMRHQTFGQMLLSIGDQIASGMIQSAIKYMLTLDMSKKSEAAAAARMGFIAGWKFPWPVNLVMAPMLGAAAFTQAMAFREGGIVPGIGSGDIVPTMLEPGEGVIPKRMMEAAKSGGDSRPHITLHAHYHAPRQVSAIDGPSVERVLTKHADKFQRHVESTIRKMNR